LTHHQGSGWDSKGKFQLRHYQKRRTWTTAANCAGKVFVTRYASRRNALCLHTITVDRLVIEAVASTVAAARESGSREESCRIPRESRNCAILAFIRNSVFNSRTGGQINSMSSSR
jgi:hypothetical protein